MKNLTDEELDELIEQYKNRQDEVGVRLLKDACSLRALRNNKDATNPVGDTGEGRF